MERLTSYKSECKREMICKYEDCNTCEEHCPHLNEDNCPCLQEVLEKLAEYEDLEEQGKLLKLPCAVGDRIWDNDFGEPCSYTVSGFSFGDLNDLNDDNLEETDQIITYYTNSNGSITGRFPANKIGKTVFLTREEAMKAIGKENLND